MERIAERFFSPGECAMLRKLPEEERSAAFFRCWTFKEAYVKALGAGISPRMRELPDAGWTLLDLPPPSGFAAAVAVRERPVTVTLWKWRDD